MEVEEQPLSVDPETIAVSTTEEALLAKAASDQRESENALDPQNEQLAEQQIEDNISMTEQTEHDTDIRDVPNNNLEHEPEPEPKPGQEPEHEPEFNSDKSSELQKIKHKNMGAVETEAEHEPGEDAKLETNNTKESKSFELEDRENILKKGLKDISITSSMTSSSSTSLISSISTQEDFFENFQEVPDIADISPIISEKEVKVEQPKTEAPRELHGYFVNPLTGIDESSSSLKEVENTDTTQYVPEVEEEGTDDDSWSEFHSDSEFKESVVVDVMEENIQEILKTMMSVIEVEEIVEDPAVKLKHELHEMITHFINELVHGVCITADANRLSAEYIKSLDVMKMLKELKIQIKHLQDEKIHNDLLDRQTVDHYKRAKMFRNFSCLNFEIDKKEYGRYIKALRKVDHLMKIERELKQRYSFTMASVLMDLQQISTVSDYANVHLEEVMRNILIRNDSIYMSRVVEQQLRLMKKLRDEISDVRLYLITRKHTLARLQEKMQAVNQVTETLNLDGFIILINQKDKLKSQIEEMTESLQKYFVKIHAETHLIAHILEKKKQITKSLSEAKQNLKNMLKKRDMLRKRISKLTDEHIHIKKTKQELITQGGLLFNQTLLYDFDETLEKVTHGHLRIAKLRRHVSYLERQIEAEMKINDQSRMLTLKLM